MAINDFLDRTAGFEDFLRKTERKPFGDKSALDKFSDLMTESNQPGAIAEGDALAGQERSAKDSALSLIQTQRDKAQQPVEQETPFRDTFLGDLAASFIPGVTQSFERQEGKQKKAALDAIFQDPNLSQQDKISALASIDIGLAKEFASTTGRTELTPDIINARFLSTATPAQKKAFSESRSLGRSPASLTENQKQVDVLKSRGFSDQDSFDIANGFVKPVTNPVTNQTELVNIATGESRKLNLQSQKTPPLAEIGGAVENNEAAQIPSLFENTALSTGVISAAKDIFAGTLGQVPGVQISEQTVQARQDLNTSQQDLVRSLITGDRFTATEMNAIKKEIEIESSILTSPSQLQQRMISIDRSLRKRLSDQERTADNDSLPVKDRQGALSNANSIKNFLDTLNVPPTIKTADDARKLPSGTIFIDPTGKIRRVP